MKKHFSFALTATLVIAVWTANANEGHDHDMEHQQANSANGTHGEHGHGEESAHHLHDSWIDPPEAYADKVGDVWADADAIARGEKIYIQQCVVCHGADGQGTGPMAESLSHPPADLTNNFHTGPGNGDAYLFWRVSEGGTVEPFKSQGSQMPAFKDTLSESQRWDVLAYVHTFFHQGLMEWHKSSAVDDSDSSNDRGS
jgi:mono/diheme cytochrome c family protein